MSTLEKLCEEYQSVEKVAKVDLDEVPVATRGGWSTRVREAQDRLQTVRKEYKATLLKNGVAIFIEGNADKCSEFAKLVLNDGDGLVADANSLYDRLAKSVEPTISEEGRQWGTSQTHRLHLALQEVMSELNISELPMPSRDSLPYVATYKDTLAHIKNLIRTACTDDLNRFYITEQALNKAIEIRYMGVLAPVVILNATTDEVKGLSLDFAKGAATIKIEDNAEINKEYLATAFKEVNKKIRPKK